MSLDGFSFVMGIVVGALCSFLFTGMVFTSVYGVSDYDLAIVAAQGLM